MRSITASTRECSRRLDSFIANYSVAPTVPSEGGAHFKPAKPARTNHAVIGVAAREIDLDVLYFYPCQRCPRLAE